MPEFVNLDGLTCLIKVGAEADQNYQNYILRGWCLGTGHLSSPGKKAGTQWGQASKFTWATLQAAARPCPWRGDAAQGWESPTPACCSPACRAVTLPSLCLAALSQIMLFVDGMQGVINHNETVQWLYTLSGSPVSPHCSWGAACAPRCTPFPCLWLFPCTVPRGIYHTLCLRAWCPGTFGCVGSSSHPSGNHPGSPERPVLM